MGIFKKAESAAVQFDINAVVAEAQAMPKVLQRPTFRDGAVYADAIARSVGMWAYQNAAALKYQGDSVETLTAKIAEVSAERAAQNRVATEARLAIHKEVGGFEGLHMFSTAGLSPNVDVDTFARQRAAESEVHRLSTELAALQPQLHAAKQHEAVKQQAAATVAALLSVFN
ncbi:MULTISPECIES: hypothetical protein [unclassified Caballeronia]|uniref:hypothetical protein n=1 Tax=unclassified Caballeronia TaxID=2646786 RepID=UPI001F187024|nr:MULTISPECIES: hypothetical protein [unclassified Caballeronia]MCE4541388.1 hypothetical protein [Caballeronia sp. PC1]MCE4569568.1 hypothetical protein [Caballeronia sp. CLC5]